MSVFQRKSNGLWNASWYESGKKKVRAFKDEQSARAFEQERLARLQDTQDRMTLGELVVSFFRYHPDYHPMTKGNILSAVAGRDKNGRHIEGVGEFMLNKYAEALSRQDLERLREAMRARGTSNNTINKIQAYIRAILAWGVDQELISRNPWHDFKRLPVKRKTFLTTIADIRKIYEAAPDWLQWAIKTMYALSLRPGHVELFGLLWSAFNWQRDFVVVQQGKSGSLKTVFPPRIYMEEAALRCQADMGAGIPLVCHRAGNRVLNYRFAWDKAVKDAGLPHIPMYDIRHVSASGMLAAGADLAAVSAQLGHSNVTTTGTFYAHVMPGSQQRAAVLLPGIEDEK